MGTRRATRRASDGADLGDHFVLNRLVQVGAEQARLHVYLPVQRHDVEHRPRSYESCSGRAGRLRRGRSCAGHSGMAHKRSGSEMPCAAAASAPPCLVSQPTYRTEEIDPERRRGAPRRRQSSSICGASHAGSKELGRTRAHARRIRLKVYSAVTSEIDRAEATLHVHAGAQDFRPCDVPASSVRSLLPGAMLPVDTRKRARAKMRELPRGPRPA